MASLGLKSNCALLRIWYILGMQNIGGRLANKTLAGGLGVLSIGINLLTFLQVILMSTIPTWARRQTSLQPTIGNIIRLLSWFIICIAE